MNPTISFGTQIKLEYLLGFGFDIFPRATRLATMAHFEQTRKYTGAPYIEHPIEVAYLVMQNIPSDYAFMADEICSAAILHDTVEDTDVTGEFIRDSFGNTVADLVEQLTFPDFEPSTSREIKVMAKTGQFSQMSPAAQLIKLCDRYHNLSEAKVCDDTFFRRYARETLPMLYCVDSSHFWTPKMLMTRLWYIANHLTDEGQDNE